MSNRGKVSTDQNVQERRLRPIYDFMDAGNYKKVIQEADRLLKKQSDFQCARALKALALLRIGCDTECKTIVEGLISGIPREENTIQALTICCRELGEPRLVCTMLDNASKSDKSENLLTTCFMAHVRVSDYQKQYQVALNLYKIYPKQTYFAWAVMSLYVKAELDQDPSSLRISLPLAEKMMGKFIEEENHVTSEHELCLYILILLRLENYKKVLTILDRLTPFEVPDLTGFVYKAKRTCLQKGGDLGKVADFLESKIVENLDEWEPYSDYIDHCCTLADGKRAKDFLVSLEKYLPSLPSKSILLGPICLFSSLVSRKVPELFDPTPYLRKYLFYYGSSPSFYADLDTFFSILHSPELKLEVAQIIKEEVYDKRGDFPHPNNVQAILNHCYVQRYLISNPEEDDIRATFEGYLEHYLNSLREEVSEDERDSTRAPSPPPTSLHDLNLRGEKAVQDRRGSPDARPVDFFSNLAALTIIEKFWPVDSEWTWPENGKSEDGNSLCPEAVDGGGGGDAKSQVVPSPDPHPISEYVPHEGNSLKDQFPECDSLKDQFRDVIPPSPPPPERTQKPYVGNRRDVGPLVVMALLQYSLDKSPRNSQARLLLGKSFIRCGGALAGVHVLGVLEFRHVMLASAAYMYKWKLVSFGHRHEARLTFNTAETFYSNYDKEGMEHVLSAYKYGSWEQVMEFLKFRDHLLNSLDLEMLTVEKSLLEYTDEKMTAFGLPTDPAFPKKVDVTSDYLKKLGSLTDCRDLDMADTFRAHPKREEWRKRSFEADVLKLRIRSALLALLNYSVVLTEELGNQQPFEGTLGKIEAVLDLLQAQLGTDTSQFVMPDITVDGMWPPEVPRYVNGKCIVFLMDLVKLSLEIGKNKTIEDFSGISTSLRACLDEVLGDEKLKKFNREPCLLDIGDIISSLAQLTETLSLSCTFLALITSMVKTLPTVRDKTKKKKTKPVNDGTTAQAEQLLLFLRSTLDGLYSVNSALESVTKVVEAEYSNRDWESLAPFFQTLVPKSLLDEILPSALPIVIRHLLDSYAKSKFSLSTLIESKAGSLRGLINGLRGPDDHKPSSFFV